MLKHPSPPRLMDRHGLIPVDVADICVCEIGDQDVYESLNKPY